VTKASSYTELSVREKTHQ